VCGVCKSHYFKGIFSHLKVIKFNKNVAVYKVDHCCNCDAKSLVTQCPECYETMIYYDNIRAETYCRNCGLVL
jgi:hypothetical protein